MTRLDCQTVSFSAWFGPRGIPSVIYLLIVVGKLGAQGYEYMLSVIVLTVPMSVFVHGITAIPLSTNYGRFAAKGNKTGE